MREAIRWLGRFAHPGLEQLVRLAQQPLQPARRAQCLAAAVASANLVHVHRRIVRAEPLKQAAQELGDGVLAHGGHGLLADAQDRQRVRRELANAVVHEPPLAQRRREAVNERVRKGQLRDHLRLVRDELAEAKGGRVEALGDLAHA